MEKLPLDWGANHIVALDAFKDATKVLELGAGNFSRSLSLAQRYPDKHFVSSDYEFSEAALEAMDDTKAQHNVTVAKEDAHALSFGDEEFDFVFSIALMEHIPRPNDALREIHRVLKPKGHHWFIQAPFWSCAKGHHFMHWDQSVLDTIPTYSHLYLSEEEMREVLIAKSPSFDVEHCLQRIYHREDLSRLSRDQTRSAVEDSPLKLLSWAENPCNAYDEKKAQEAMSRLRYPVTLEEMKVSGATVLQQKQVSRPPSTTASKLRKLRKHPIRYFSDMIDKKRKK